MTALIRASAQAIPLAAETVQCVVTSPPYWGLRDYGLGQWGGGDAECGHQQQLNQYAGKRPDAGNKREGWPNNTCGLCGAFQQPSGIGLEPTLGEWVANIVAVMREVRRVLRDDGTAWLNLGDAYTSGGRKDSPADSLGGPFAEARASKERRLTPGIGPKNLMGQPWRVAFALQDDGWILRSAIVWHKPNPMPESVTDRPTSAYEMVFLLSKQGRYFYDAESIRQEASPNALNRPGTQHRGINGDNQFKQWSPETAAAGANARNVWTIPTQGRPEAHFATFPDELPRRCILAGSRPGDLVLDPFVGSGTTVAVAQSLGRRSVGLDLSAEYIDLARKRIDPLGGAQADARSANDHSEPTQLTLDV